MKIQSIEDADFLILLGSIESSLNDIKKDISSLPCKENTATLIELKQSYLKDKEYAREQKENGINKQTNKFKFNAQTIAIIAILISAIAVIITAYSSFKTQEEVSNERRNISQPVNADVSHPTGGRGFVEIDAGQSVAISASRRTTDAVWSAHDAGTIFSGNGKARRSNATGI